MNTATPYDIMGSEDLDPTNPVVLAVTLRQVVATLGELVRKVDQLGQRPTCQKPDLCISLEREVNELHDLSKEWQKIAQERESRVRTLEHRTEKLQETIDELKEQNALMREQMAAQKKEFEERIKPFEEAKQQAKGARWAAGIVWTFVTSGVLGVAFVIWKLVEAAQGKH